MSIQELSVKFKGFLQNPEYMLTALVIVTASVSFWLGRLSVHEVKPHQNRAEVQNVSAAITSSNIESKNGELLQADQAVAVEGGYVASKSGTKYHLPWCAGAKQIKESNKIWFKTKEEAEKAGYTPASNCKGI